MKAPWPKLSTSIRPNTSVSPDAMMKIIMPMARLATVSVTQALPDPVKSSVARARVALRPRGGRVWLPPTRPPDAPPQSRDAPRQCRHLAAMHDFAVVHHQH